MSSSGGKGRRSPRRIRLDIHALPDIRLPYGRWAKSHADVQKWYTALYPVEGLLPEKRNPSRPLPVSDKLVDMIRGGDIVVRRFPSMKKVAMALTPKGRNTVILNRFYSSPTAFRLLPWEQRDFLVWCAVRAVVNAMDYNPALQKMERQNAVRQVEVVRQLKGDANLRLMEDSLVERYGPDHSSWPKSVFRYYTMQSKRSVLAETAIRWVSKKENWQKILRERTHNTL